MTLDSTRNRTLQTNVSISMGSLVCSADLLNLIMLSIVVDVKHSDPRRPLLSPHPARSPVLPVPPAASIQSHSLLINAHQQQSCPTIVRRH